MSKRRVVTYKTQKRPTHLIAPEGYTFETGDGRYFPFLLPASLVVEQGYETNIFYMRNPDTNELEFFVFDDALRSTAYKLIKIEPIS